MAHEVFFDWREIQPKIKKLIFQPELTLYWANAKESHPVFIYVTGKFLILGICRAKINFVAFKSIFWADYSHLPNQEFVVRFTHF